MHRTALLAGLVSLAGCSYATDAAFGGPDGEGPGGTGPGGSSGTSGNNGGDSGVPQPEPETCGDGAKNGAESDVDCGGACDAKCAVGKACGEAADCADSNLCTGGLCAAPNGTDQVKNGDESDVDCGGTTTGALRCAVGKLCLASTDCESRGCGYQGTCVEAPSCAVHFGGDTCGAGEVGSGGEQHESCCTSLEVPGYADPAHPGKAVTLDKYEATAGRVREFVTQISTTLGGVPNVRAWIEANRPEVWNDGWNAALVSSADELKFSFGAAGGDDADFSSGFYIHGQNCAIAAGRPGYPTYWQPADVLASMQNVPRDFDQPTLDVKAMSCISNAMLAAFCAWDGGQIATTAVLDAVTGGNPGQPSPPINYSGDAAFGPQDRTYAWPYAGTNENGGRVAPPGRIAQDSVAGAAGNWMDLIGNLNEMALQDVDGGFALLYSGLGSSSARALQNPEAIPRPAYKAAYSGGRCMRFR